MSGRLSLGEKSKQMRVDTHLFAHEPNRAVVALVFCYFSNSVAIKVIGPITVAALPTSRSSAVRK